MLTCSVVIPTYNRQELLSRTLESLTRQTLPRDRFEVIVVDDGSSDGTARVVDGFRDRLTLRYHFQEDKGFRAAKARNMGIADALSDVCVFLDSGVIAHSGCLAAHVASHRSATGPVAVVGYVYCMTLDNEDAGLMNRTLDFGDADKSIALMRERGLWPDIREAFYAKYGDDDFGDLPAPWVVYWTCNVSAGTAQLRSVGMFDEAFQRWGGEDLDLGYRLHRNGARVVLNRDAASVHIPHDKSSVGNQQISVSNYDYMVRKYGTPIIALMPGFATSEVSPMNINDIIRDRGLPSCADDELRRQAG